MSEVSATTSDGGLVELDADTLDALRNELRGPLLTRGQQGYEEARTVWNAMIDRRPALVARCLGVADVLQSVRFARERGLLLSIRGGGHNVAGKALCDGGLMIDLSLMREIRVDPDAQRARVGPGATLADFDHESQAFALATPLGINSTTGVAGLTLGGGFGWLSRKYGLSIDNLVSADVVTAGGDLVHASEQEEPELFWGIRGGGGNFGVVTSFEFELHPVGPEVLSGLIVHRLEDLEEVLSGYRTMAAEAPDELSCWVVVRKAPPLPFIPGELHGREVVIMALMVAGDVDGAGALADRVRRLKAPVAELVIPHPYTAWQQAFDPLLTPGARNYWKSQNFTELPDELLRRLSEFGAKLPTAQTEIFIGQLGGATSRVPPDATAYPHRDAEFVMNVHTRWDDPARDDDCVEWARAFQDATSEFATGGVYVNFLSEGEERVRAAFGANYDRLAALKKRFDPENLRINQNIAPAGG